MEPAPSAEPFEERPQSSASLELSLLWQERFSLAMKLGGVPLVRAVTIRNTGEAPLEDLALALRIEPDAAPEQVLAIGTLPPGQSWECPPLARPLVTEERLGQAERFICRLEVEVRRGDRCLLARTYPVELLAQDEWGGFESWPEGLAAFVRPDHPLVERVLAGAGPFQEGPGAESPGQEGPEEQVAQVRARVAALFHAARELGLSLERTPVDFERQIQRIRPLDEIAAGRPGSSLDFALLMAACLERAGSRPLVGLSRGHAFGGVWLAGGEDGEALESDPGRLRGRVEAGAIALFDATALTALPGRTFGEAERAARGLLEDDADFLGLLDVAAARTRSILPLPPRKEARSQSAAGASAPPEPRQVRLERWRGKLLDLTLRNRLLNFRETRLTLGLNCSDPAGLEDALARGASFQLAPEPEDPALTEEGKLYCSVTEAELSRRLLDLYRASRLSLEESGANTLYLALGFLVWYEDPGSETARRAPILLLPLEIQRPSVREGFRVRLAEEDPLLNVTLLRKLESDFGLVVEGLEELPTDESGLDVASIFDRFRQAVSRIPRWEVVSEAWIGLFSFTKFLMWRDLERLSGDLAGNPVVGRLLSGSGEGWGGPAFPDPDTLDRTHAPETTFCPLDADASQLAAVFAAAEGKSFVLQGPPGTGKSQTIANLIAHSLAEGRRVLFVAEKRAALEVVQRRLKSLGLDSFCLEVHSNKTHKRDVVARLGNALEQARVKAPARWAEEAARLGELRGALNRLPEALHEERPAGLSFHQAVGRLVELGPGPEVALDERLIREADRSVRETLRGAVEELALAAAPLGDLSVHPWRPARRADWSPALARRVGELLGCLAAALARAEEAAVPVGRLFGSDPAEASLEQLELWDRAAGLLPDSPRPALPLLEQQGFEELRERTAGWIRLGRCREELRGRLFPAFGPGVLELDLRALRERLHRAEKGFVVLGWLRRRSVLKALKGAAERNVLPAGLKPRAVIEDGLMLREVEEELAGAVAEPLWGATWQGLRTDWDRLERELAWVEAWRALLDRAPDRAAWADLAVRGITEEQVTRLQAWHGAFEEVRGVEAALEAELKLDGAAAWGVPGEQGFLGRAGERVALWESRLEELREWCAFLRTVEPVREAGAGALVEAAEAGSIAPEQYLETFDRSFLRPWAEARMEQEPLLGSFFGGEQERKIHTFQEQDRRCMSLARDLVRARLGSRLPPPGAEGPAGSGSEMAILRREVRKRARHLPLRRLFVQISNLLGSLTPCFLMSPLSAAQYLDAEMGGQEPFFDLVVFDEASQIPPWDALGVLARGRQAVVVGDSRQLPPTSFFQRLEGEEEFAGEEDLEDLESILEECEAAALPSLALRWHFRSRHESLIAFSNHHYYEDRLVVFPSPERSRKRLGVVMRRVPDAVYGKGGSRTNRREAEQVVAEVVRRLGDPLESGRSLGVVTFNMAQQRLIEDLLDQARRERPELEPFFAEDATEPVFVKNLENVQGDERDVILFSICYGPDALGKVSMNFGPLNRKGGERRLNVAITRAREQVVIFTALSSDRIDLSRTDALGVRHLRDYLDYAERGEEALGTGPVPATGGQFDSPFEVAVCRALEAAGHGVHLQVGSAGYRIDLAVVDPERPGRYLIGIECDGASYHSSRNARERDRLRGEVLRRLGWRLHRVWSTDWWASPAREMARLEAALAEALEARESDPLDRVVPGEQVPPEALPQGSEAAVGAVEPEEMFMRPDAPSAGPEAEQRAAAGQVVYASSPSADLGGPEDFFAPRREGTLLGRLKEVLEHEAPIHVDLAARRVAEAFHIERVTARIRGRIAALLAAWPGPDRPALVDDFLWLASQDPETYALWRVPGEGHERAREAGEIPPQESAAAAAAVLREQVSLPREELVRLVALRFGFGRMGKKVVAAMEAGVGLLVLRGGCEEQGDRVSRPRVG